MIDGCILTKKRPHATPRYTPDVLVVAEPGRGRLPVVIGYLCPACSQSFRAGVITEGAISNAVWNDHADAVMEAEGGVQPDGSMLSGTTQIVVRDSRCSCCMAPLDPAPYYLGPMCPACVLAAEHRAARIASAAEHLAAKSHASMLEQLRDVLALKKIMDGDVTETTRVPALPTQPQETPMSTTPPTHPMLQTLQTDATDAAWRTAGAQFVKLARDPLAAVLCRHLGPDDPAFRARVAAFLQTELGASILSAVLSAGLSALPQASGPVPERLARELRVRAMSGVGDTLADVLMGPLREVASLYLRGEPETAPPPAELPAGHSRATPFRVTDDEHAARGDK